MTWNVVSGAGSAGVDCLEGGLGGDDAGLTVVDRDFPLDPPKLLLLSLFPKLGSREDFRGCSNEVGISSSSSSSSCSNNNIQYLTGFQLNENCWWGSTTHEDSFFCYLGFS